MLAPAHASGPPSPRPSATCAAGAGECPGAARGSARANRLHECDRLRAAILESEQAERRGRTPMMEGVQHDLFSLRQRFRKLGCQVPASK